MGHVGHPDGFFHANFAFGGLHGLGGLGRDLLFFGLTTAAAAAHHAFVVVMTAGKIRSRVLRKVHGTASFITLFAALVRTFHRRLLAEGRRKTAGGSAGAEPPGTGAAGSGSPAGTGTAGAIARAAIVAARVGRGGALHYPRLGRIGSGNNAYLRRRRILRAATGAFAVLAVLVALAAGFGYRGQQAGLRGALRHGRGGRSAAGAVGTGLVGLGRGRGDCVGGGSRRDFRTFDGGFGLGNRNFGG